MPAAAFLFCRVWKGEMLSIFRFIVLVVRVTPFAFFSVELSSS